MCPFAALSAVIDAGGEINLPKRKTGSSSSNVATASAAASGHPKLFDSNGNLTLTCPMTGISSPSFLCPVPVQAGHDRSRDS